MTFANKDELTEIILHARSQERCVVEFQTDENGVTRVLDITDHVARLENENHEDQLEELNDSHAD